MVLSLARPGHMVAPEVGGVVGGQFHASHLGPEWGRDGFHKGSRSPLWLPGEGRTDVGQVKRPDVP